MKPNIEQAKEKNQPKLASNGNNPPTLSEIFFREFDQRHLAAQDLPALEQLADELAILIPMLVKVGNRTYDEIHEKRPDTRTPGDKYLEEEFIRLAHERGWEDPLYTKRAFDGFVPDYISSAKSGCSLAWQAYEQAFLAGAKGPELRKALIAVKRAVQVNQILTEEWENRKSAMFAHAGELDNSRTGDQMARV